MARAFRRIAWCGVLAVLGAAGAAVYWAAGGLAGEPEPIRIAFVGSLSGKLTSMGETARDAVVVAAEEINEAGGIDGRRVEIVSFDNAGDPGTIRGIVDRLAGEKVKLVIGPLTSNMARPILEAIEGRDLLVLSPTISTDAVKDLDDNFIRFANVASAQSEGVAQAAIADGCRRIAVIYDIANREYTETVVAHFKKFFASDDRQVVYENDLQRKGLNEYARIAREIQAADADGAVLVTSGIDGAAIVQQIRKAGLDIRLYGATWVKTNNFIAHGGRAVEGVRLVGWHGSRHESAGYRRFLDRFRATSRQEANWVAMAAYETARVALQAVAACGGDDPALVKRWILQTSKFQVLDEPFTINAYGDCHRPMAIFVVRDGRFVTEPR